MNRINYTIKYKNEASDNSGSTTSILDLFNDSICPDGCLNNNVQSVVITTIRSRSNMATKPLLIESTFCLREYYESLIRNSMRLSGLSRMDTLEPPEVRIELEKLVAWPKWPTPKRSRKGYLRSHS